MTELTLGLLVLRSSQMEASLAFYHAIGLSFVEEKHGSGPIHYSCRVGASVIEIYPGSAREPQNHQESGATLLGFNVSSLDTVLDTLKQIGAPVLTDPKMSAWGRRAVVQDPDGRAVELLQPIR
jgi:predicted enzyme related to lactoylglutathione lyase